MNGPETRGRTVEAQNGGFLSASLGTEQLDLSRRRSSSLTPSFRSSRSDITTIEEKPELLDKNAAIKRQKTLRVSLQLSWWDLFKALFLGPAKTAREMARRIEPEFEEDTEIFDESPCPFMLTVSVFPLENPVPERHQQVRCTFDTGCLQGNIVSLDLVRRLGYMEFDKLRPREQNGGMTVLGGTVRPEGAIHLSWYHSSSAQVFKDMRFLVLANANADLVIGAHAIVKYNLISPPNFKMDKGLYTVPPGDPGLEELDARVAKRKTRLENLQRKRKPDRDNKELDVKIETAERDLDIAEENRKLYKTEQILKWHPNNDKMRKLAVEIRKRLNELQEEEVKSDPEKGRDKKGNRHSTPDIRIQEPNAKI